MRLDKSRLFDENYDAAVDYFGTNLGGVMSADDINALDEKLAKLANAVPDEKQICNKGSGFGALEIMRMEIDGDGVAPTSMIFPKDTIG